MRRIVSSITLVGRTLSINDVAYSALIDRGDSGPFRKFLIDGPDLFCELGESGAILGYIGSFWAYRMANTEVRATLAPNA